MNGKVTGDARAVQTGIELVCKYWESNGQVPAVGGKLESWLRQIGTFSEVNVHEAAATFGSQVSAGTRPPPPPYPPERCSRGKLDSKLGGLGLTFKNSWRSAFSGKTHPGLVARGFTPEFKEQFLEEFDNVKSEWRTDYPLYCVWARKSV